jgi:hypothetical protein
MITELRACDLCCLGSAQHVCSIIFCREPTCRAVCHAGYANSLLFMLKGWKFAPIKLLLRILIWVLGRTTQLAVSYDAPLLPVDTAAPAG